MPTELVTLQQAKGHLRVGHDHFDADIQLKLNAATLMALEYLDRAVYADQAALNAAMDSGDAGVLPMVVNDMVRSGILLLLGDLFANREETVTGTIATQLPTGARACLRPYRRMGA